MLLFPLINFVFTFNMAMKTAPMGRFTKLNHCPRWHEVDLFVLSNGKNFGSDQVALLFVAWFAMFVCVSSYFHFYFRFCESIIVQLTKFHVQVYRHSFLGIKLRHRYFVLCHTVSECPW